MTTLNLDNELFQQASKVAAAQGQTLDDFVGRALQHALLDACVSRSERNGLPVMVVNERLPEVNPRVVRQAVEEDGY